MHHLLKQLFDKLGRPNEQKSENVSFAVIYCMFLAFTLVCILGMVSVVQFTHLHASPTPSCPPASLTDRS